MKALFVDAGYDKIQMIPSGGGVFEISKDSVLCFSKKSLGRFPTAKELKQLIGES